MGSGETVQHMVLECHTWEEFRCGQFTDLSTLLGGSSGVTGGVGLTKLEVESWCGTPESTHSVYESTHIPRGYMASSRCIKVF